MDLETLLFQVAQPDGPRVCADSRQIAPGDVFVAICGSRVDGHDFLVQATKQGAGTLIIQQGRSFPTPLDIPVIPVHDPNFVLGQLAQAQAGNPARELINLGVTGTNGKTTVATLTQACFQAAGQSCGLIGTIQCDTGRQVITSAMTTPDALALADLQRQMVAAGCTAMVTEASSHALDQQRLAGIDFRAAAFTNLTGDHLDYHGTEENYLDAKARLFESLAPDSIAILNRESPQSEILAGRTQAEIWWYGIDSHADLCAQVQCMDATGTVYQLTFGNQSTTVHSPLLGRHNLSNHLAAAGLALAGGVSLQQVAEGLSHATVPGRLERVDAGQDFTVLVDYAHTDDALDHVLSTLRPLCNGQLIVVFGCGGDRDRSKRPRMARVAQQWADVIVVTSDNPRSETPEQIIADIQTGFEPGTLVSIVPDRRMAIGLALEQAREGDIVLIAGKGHETYQLIGDQRLDFDDCQVARDFLNGERV